MTGRKKKQARLKQAYLITGSDETKVERAAHRLRERVVSDSGTDLNLDIFDASRDSAHTVIQAANTPPFCEGLRLVMVLHVGDWHKADKDIVSAFLAEPPGYCCLALVGRGLRKNEALYKAVKAAGEVLTFDAPRQSDLPAWVVEQARQRQLKMGAAEARRLISLAGSEQRAILSELDKLAAYKQGGSVGMDDIDAVCWSSTEVKTWDLTDALGARDRLATFRRLEELLADHTDPNAVFYSLANHLKRLSVVTEAGELGEDPARAAASLGMKPYPAKKLAGQSRRFTAEGLRRALAIFSELDADLKGRASLRPDMALELAVARVLDAVAA